MKQFFIMRLFTAIIEAATGAVDAPLTSDKLTELKAAYRVAFKEIQKIEDPFSKEAKDAKLAAWKIEGEIKAEEAALLKAVNDAKIAEQRNLRLQLNANQLTAHEALIAINADKKATPEQKQAALDTFNSAKELVDNELLAKYAASKSAKAGTEPKAESGEKAANKAAILELARAGKNHKDIEAAGFARSTVWHTINNAKIAGESFPNA